tara:strand:- start:676 stop:1029 length:354 start_codon:yes stop_codon:yes gene_type:complete
MGWELFPHIGNNKRKWTAVTVRVGLIQINTPVFTAHIAEKLEVSRTRVETLPLYTYLATGLVGTVSVKDIAAPVGRANLHIILYTPGIGWEAGCTNPVDTSVRTDIYDLSKVSIRIA